MGICVEMGERLAFCEPLEKDPLACKGLLNLPVLMGGTAHGRRCHRAPGHSD